MSVRTPASDHAPAEPSAAPNPGPSAEGIWGGLESICARVREAARESLGLLAELQPVGPHPDIKGIDELKSWIRSEFMELVGELSFEDGPSVTRVEDVFSMLLDQMGTLQDLMEDEEGATAFPALADQIAALYRSWNNMQQLFEVQIGIVAKHLNIAITAVDEVRAQMDAASIGFEQRRVMLVNFEASGLDHPSISIEGLLGGIQTFLAETAREIIAAGGGFALRTGVRPAAAEWCNLVRASLHDDASGTQARHFTPQVIHSLAALASRLDEVAWNC
jgi:hypothetical protein